MLFQWAGVVISVLSILLNLLLLYAYIKLSNKALGAYKYYILLFIVCDLAYSLTIVIAQPAVIIYQGTMALVASSGIPNIHMLQVNVSIVTYVVMIFLCCYFYRYQVLCLYNDCHKRLVKVVTALLCLQILIGDQVFLMIAFQPKPAAIAVVFEVAKQMYNLDMEGKEMLAVNTNEDTGLVKWMMYQVILQCLITISVSIFCGYKIFKKMSLCIISENTRKLNRKLFRLLICQSTVPVFFLYWPWVTFAYYVINHLSMSELNMVIQNLFNCLFPLANAIVLLIFMDKYRLCIRRLFGFKSNLSTSVHMISSPRASDRTSFRQNK